MTLSLQCRLFPAAASCAAVPKLRVPVRAVRAVRNVPDIHPGRAPKGEPHIYNTRCMR